MRHLTDEDLDAVAAMLIPRLDALTAAENPDGRHRGCWIEGCDRAGYARGLCQPHHQKNKAWKDQRQ